MPESEAQSGFIHKSTRLSNLTFSEEERVKAIRRYRLDDPSWFPIFQDIARLAAQLLSKPHGAVNIVGKNAVWNTARNKGLRSDTLNEFGFCPLVVDHAAPLVVNDTSIDQHFNEYPSVITGAVGNYCGVPLFTPEGQPIGSVCAWGDGTFQYSSEHVEGLTALSRQASMLLQLHHNNHHLEQDRQNQRLASQIMTDIVAGRSLEEVLTTLVVSIERQTEAEGTKCSILTVENGIMKYLAAPSLPKSYIEKTNGLPVESAIGTCSRAVSTRVPAVSYDISIDPSWEPISELALAYGLRSCCSLPIFGNEGEVIATFALYYGDTRYPDPEHWKILDDWATLVGLAITRSRDQVVLRQNASCDPLTGLPNRITLTQIIDDLLALRRNGAQIAVFLVDLDGFKLLNDSLGHAHGDEFIVQLSNRLTEALQPMAEVCRLGGDEFVIVLQGIYGPKEAESFATKILELIRVPTVISGRSITLTGSIGVAISEHESTADELLRQADSAMYNSKSRGRNTFSLADEKLRLEILKRFETEVDLRSAISKRQLSLVYQPNLDMSTGIVSGVEALLRWKHPTKGDISPDLFIPIAEDSDIITDIGSWALLRACTDMAAKREHDPFFKNVRLWVNVSSKQLNSSFLSTIANVLETSRLPSNRLGLEITESIFMQDVKAISTILIRLRANGISIAIDDFGTGFSSLAQLRTLPVDVIKIDKAFIDGLGVSGSDESVVIAIIRLAEALGIQTVAEGVETESQRTRLLELGCPRAQGYLFSSAVPLDEIDTNLTV